MEFYRIWRILLGHKWVVIGLPIVATLVALGLTYVLPEQYESTALVLVKPFEDIKFNPTGGQKEIADFPVSLSAPIDAVSKTYVEVIQSPSVAVKIVNALRLDIKKPKIYTTSFEVFKDQARAWVKSTIRTVRNYCKYGRDIPASPFELAVEDIKNNLVVSPKKDTYAFEITYRSGDPNEAAAVANTAAQIFVEQSSESYRTEWARAREFLEKQLGESRKGLEQARAAVLVDENSDGAFQLKSEYTDELKNVADLEDTLAKDEGKLAGLQRLAGGNSTPSVIAQEAEIAELKGQLSTWRAQLAAYPQKATRLNALNLTQRLAEDSYEFFLRQYQEARVKESATVTEIRIVSPAMASLYPVKLTKVRVRGTSLRNSNACGDLLGALARIT